jgi:hypothetical protein
MRNLEELGVVVRQKWPFDPAVAAVATKMELFVLE